MEPEAEYEYLGASLLDVMLIITNSLVELFSSSLLPLHLGVMLLLLKSNFTLKVEHALRKKKLSKLITFTLFSVNVSIDMFSPRAAKFG